MSSERIYIYKRYERFWHWSQALLIITMMITGFEVHGTYTLLGFQKAVQLHSVAAWTLLTLWAFTIFWQFTTGEWRQYLPSLKNVMAMVHYYTIGIFTNAPHPFHKTVVQKHNPLQRRPHCRRLHDHRLLLHPRLSDHHRPHRFCPYQGNDYRLGRC